MKVIKAPDAYEPEGVRVRDLPTTRITPPTLFLAGSIEMGKAELWQDKVCEELKDIDGVIFNPRRDEWDSSWEQNIDNPEFKKQVDWELKHLELADSILFYFQPGTKCPITLLELGLHLTNFDQRCYVVCPEGFWRKGNVDITCARYGHEVHEDLSSALNVLRQHL